MERRQYLAALAGMGMLAGCSSDDDPDAATPENTTEPSTPTSTPTETTDPLDIAEITIDGFRYPTEADGYEGELPGVVLEDTLRVAVGVDVPVSVDGEFDADLVLDVEDGDGDVVVSDTQRVDGTTSSSSDGTIQLFREFEFDASDFEYAEYRVLAEAEDFQTDTEDADRETFRLLRPDWEARAEVVGHMEDAKAILADAVDIYHNAGDSDWLDVTAGSSETSTMNTVRGRAFEAQPVEVDARQAAVDSSLDYRGTWEARIDRIAAERELIRAFGQFQIELFDAHAGAIQAFEQYEQRDRTPYISTPDPSGLEDDLESFEAWREPVADYWPKLEQMEADINTLQEVREAGEETRDGIRHHDHAEAYYDDGRYGDAESAAMTAIGHYETALDDLFAIDGLRDLRRSCRLSVEPLRDAATDLRDDARDQQ